MDKRNVKVRLLLVDDEEAFLTSVSRVLNRRNIEVFTACGGKEAFEILRRQEVDVVVLDIKMPGMDGLDVLRRVKAGPVNREVILLTGHPTVETAMAGMKQGAFEYMIKPPDITRLAELIHKAYQLRMEKLAREQQETIQDILRRYPD